jgi:hypothetical protein
MSSLVFNLGPQQVIVATDTLAVGAATEEPCYFSSKAYPLAHLNGIMCVTGMDEFGVEWFTTVRRLIARDLHHADDFIAPMLREMGSRYPLGPDSTSTVYHFGYSQTEQQFVGYAYRSTDGFASERLQYGFSHKPGVAGAKLESYPDDIIDLMKAQRRSEIAKPVEDRVYIGGDVLCYILTDRSMTIQAVHRFDDYGYDYELMCAGIPVEGANNG